MPLGTEHKETGLLLTEGRFVILQMDDGGRWRIDNPEAVVKLLGRRVTITGRRSGFDLLTIRKVSQA